MTEAATVAEHAAHALSRDCPSVAARTPGGGTRRSRPTSSAGSASTLQTISTDSDSPVSAQTDARPACTRALRAGAGSTNVDLTVGLGQITGIAAPRSVQLAPAGADVVMVGPLDCGTPSPA